ncbi:uncharacterized protein LOC129961670 [Argiope bruennichi]|uniref:uncharacterized protein LOC129961670 n=1 Tax=Argiope bruennichi TaxID=94029 RepID=UPI002494F980|nr:uncharacterized protein LOC129961670 [Argiope bruennichi]
MKRDDQQRFRSGFFHSLLLTSTEHVPNYTMALVSLPGFIVFVAVLATGRSENLTVNCFMDVHGNCDKQFSLIFHSDKPLYAWTDEELSIYCREIADNIDCKQEYLKQCTNETTLFFFESATQGIRDLAVDVCNETSDMRADFRSHIGCIKNALYDAGCAASSKRRSEIEMPDNSEDMTSGERRVKQLCSHLELFLECITTKVERSCGRNATNFVGAAISRTFDTLQRHLCVEGKWNDLFMVLEFAKETFENNEIV